MRWDNLSAPHDQAVPGGPAPAAPPLPLALPGAVARTFDTPAFAGMTFYEVRAKSIINRVPRASRVPFEWTINPYRGCSHACAYCISGDTPILTADGRTKPMADVRVGDRIYGTVREGNYRRYVPTEVLAHWSTVKPAYRVTLADGTTLIASGEHRFLTDRGWKHVTGSMCGDGRRPYLTSGNKLMGLGRFAEPPKETIEYRRGYLCGMIRGDAHLGSYSYLHGEAHRFRLALVDAEALGRSRRFLADFGVQTTEFLFTHATVTRQEVRAIRTSKKDDIDAITQLIRWPDEPTEDWRLGFLAGIFDAEGSCSGGILRITNADDRILDQITGALRRLEFDSVVEDRNLPNNVRAIRLRGGLRERLRFFHLTDPAITRKRTIDGVAIKGKRDLRVVSIEPLGLELPLYDITTGTGDFIANGVVSHNCFARNTHTYLDLDAGRDFDSKVVVKVNAGELVRRELAAPKWRGDHIAMGTNVDCYQRAEGRYQLMPQVIGALRDFANPFSILTKGTLILRDLPLLRQSAEVTRVGVSFSVGFVDEALWRSVEAGTPSPRRRLDAVRTLTEAGFSVGVLMAPILPALTDTDESIEATVSAIAAAGAVSVTPIPLHLRPGAREWYAGWLAREFPALVPRYRELFRGGSYLPQTYQREVTARVRMAARRYGLGRTEAGDARQVAEQRPKRAAAEQLTLL
jgi:DNA repair photolyase